ncbi:hypothetical protein [Mycobacterium kyogaense]|uniref:helix-turn-helix domain-containing protein n=1 Tax=Mycobacterium kyogaense TaxID=2212479 RepID=UPI003FA5D762
MRGTIAGVAEALHQSPSSVSQALARLEHDVGGTATGESRPPGAAHPGRRSARRTHRGDPGPARTGRQRGSRRAATKPPARCVSPCSSPPPRRSCRRCSPNSRPVIPGCE